MTEQLLVVASHNPVKARAVRDGYAQMFPKRSFRLEHIGIPSGIADQPRSDRETRQGAMNRAQAAAQARPDADVCFGIEGGVEDDGDDLVAFAWVIALGRDDGGESRIGRSRSASFALPDAVTALVRKGKELGEADDLVFGQCNSKQQGGAVGLLTGNAVDRAALYTQPTILALIPFRSLPERDG